jgi:predicted nucleotidyltransferase
MATRRMRELDPDFKAFIELLNSEGVRYLLVGGYAVNRYGHHRSTQDIDFWIAADQTNAERVVKVLRQFGFASPPSVREIQDKRLVHKFGLPPIQIDLLTNPSGVDFESCYARSKRVLIDDTPVQLISLEDLRANKRASGRGKDLVDLEALDRLSDE